MYCVISARTDVAAIRSKATGVEINFIMLIVNTAVAGRYGCHFRPAVLHRGASRTRFYNFREWLDNKDAEAWAQRLYKPHGSQICV